MKIVIATDIHGTNDKLRSMLQPLGDDLLFLSPWDGDGCPYASEEEAVRVFHSTGGLRKYENKITQAVASEPVLLVGFSVGASSIWLYTESPQCHPQSRAILYYGSRIRDHQKVVPRCAVSLVFAEFEHSFEPRELMTDFAHKGMPCRVVGGTSHGFLNPLSANYSAKHALAEIEYLKQLCVTHS